MGAKRQIGDVLGRVRMLSLDVDGVHTDGALYYAEDGGQIRKFHVRDGVGMKRVLAAGVEMALITASKTQAIRLSVRSLLTCNNNILANHNNK